jgi:hypothetical protein
MTGGVKNGTVCGPRPIAELECGRSGHVGELGELMLPSQHFEAPRTAQFDQRISMVFWLVSPSFSAKELRLG